MSKEALRWIATAQEPSAPLIRLLVPVKASLLPGADEYHDNEHAVQLAALQLTASLCALQPGGPCVSWPSSSNQQVTVVVCGKANAAAGYKALAANAVKLGFRLGDVKSTVLVAPMQFDDLQRTAEAAVCRALKAQNWYRLGPSWWVHCDFLAAEPGRCTRVAATELTVRPASASTATLALTFRNPGMYKFCPVWPLHEPPNKTAAASAAVANATDVAPGADGGAAAAGAAAAAGCSATTGPDAAAAAAAAAAREEALTRLFADKAALRRAVARLSDSRVVVVGPGVPAYILGLKPLPHKPAAVQRLRDAWLSCFGLQLPERLGGFIAEVAASPEADPDDAQDVPGCCVWMAGGGGGGGGDGGAASGGGLVPVPPAQCTEGPEQVMSRLLDDLATASRGAFPFWGPTGLSPRQEAPPGAEAALAKRQAGGPQPAAAAPAPAAATACGTGGPGASQPAAVARENTGWTAAVEVAASGFREPEALAPAAAVLRRTIDPDVDGGIGPDGGGCGGGGVSAAERAEAEAVYGDEAAEAAASGGGGNAAAREAILQRSSEEALRAAAALRAANRAKERALWERHRTFWEARKADEGDVGGGGRGGGGSAGAGTATGAAAAPRAPQFGSGAAPGLSRPVGLLLGKGRTARPLLKAPAVGSKKAAAAGAKTGKATGATKAAAGAGTKAKATKAAKATAAEAAGDGSVEPAEASVAAAAAAAAAPKPPQKRPAKTAVTGADGAPAKKRAKAAAPVAAAAAAGAAAAPAAAGPSAAGDPAIAQLPPAVQPAAAPPSAAAAAVAAAVAADMYDANDADDFVQPTAAPAEAGITAPAKKSAAATKGAKAAAAAKRSAAVAAAAAGAGQDAAAGEAATGAAEGAPAPDDGAAPAAAAAAAAAAKEARKRTKAADLDLAVVEAKVSAAASSGRLSGLTLPEMQCWLRARKAPVSGKKVDVEARLAALLGLAPPAAAAAAAAAAPASAPAVAVS